jgi:hypothetical protein
MKKKMRQHLHNAFEAPLPQKKSEFIQSLNYPKTRRNDFLLSQLGYIHRKVWIASACLFIAVIIFVTQIQTGDIRLLWLISALTPFFVMTSITEIARSSVFGMEELEMSTKYNLKSILLARMGILGTGNMLVLLAVLPILAEKVNIGIVNTAVYLMVPYLLTCILSCMVLNRIGNKEIPLYCAGAAAIVSILGFILNSVQSAIYQERYFIIWVAILIVLIILLFRGLRQLINNMEEMKCNLSLTD